MRQRLWLGVLFLSASWLFFIPQFTEPDIDIGIFLLILGIICIIGGLHGLLPKPLGFRFTVLIIPVIAALFFVRFPSNMGLVVLAIGLLISVLSHKWRILQTISLGISLSGLILLIQAMVFPCYVSFVSHGHRVDILASVISPLANLLGLRTSTNNNLLYVQGIQQIYPVTITWEKQINFSKGDVS